MAHTPEGVYAKGNYGANTGIGPMQPGPDPLCKSCAIPRKPGLFTNNSGIRMSKIRDGTSHTVAVSEMLKARQRKARSVRAGREPCTTGKVRFIA